MNMRRILQVMTVVSVVPTTAVLVIAARGCDWRHGDSWTDRYPGRKDPTPEDARDAKQVLIDRLLELQQRADTLHRQTEAEHGENDALAGELHEVRTGIAYAEREIATLTQTGPHGALAERPHIEDQLARLDDRLDRAERGF